MSPPTPLAQPPRLAASNALAGPNPTPSDPVAAFLACHDRIRTFCDGLSRMAALPDLSDPRVPPSAAQAHRYFSIALPLHAADEDRSLAPRLLRVAPGTAPVLAELAEDHAGIDRLLLTLNPMLEALSQGGMVPVEALRAQVDALRGLLLPHIAREERELFPRCAALSEADRHEIMAELLARRS